MWEIVNYVLVDTLTLTLTIGEIASTYISTINHMIDNDELHKYCSYANG